MKRKSIMVAAFVFCVGLLSCLPAWSEVRLPKIFGDHMVLQRDQPIPVWGWANPACDVSVKLGDGPVQIATADAVGRWSLKLAPQSAGGPMKLTVSGETKIELSDVLIGEVWVCSGQSNMEFRVSASINAEQEIASAKYPRIRHIKIPRQPVGFPKEDVSDPKTQWTVCSPETVGSYTAVGYFFGRYLQKELDVPIGLINSSWGGTRIEPWTPPCGFAQVPKLADILRQVELTNPMNPLYKATLGNYLVALDSWIADAKRSLVEQLPVEPPPSYPKEISPLTSHQAPTTLYNGMIHPLVPFGIRGAIWYQGESNHGEGMLYCEKMKALIGGWRTVWKQGQFPFFYVQIAPYQYGNESSSILPAFWEAQASALKIPNTGMAVIHDIGNLKNIHPKNKQDVGKRLALIALAKTYGQDQLVFRGPTFKTLKQEGNRLRVVFDHVGSGLVARDGKPLNWFEIIGPDSVFTKAEAVIDGDSVLLSAPNVKSPCAVRFAWHKLAEPNLANKEGLPAVPFRAGEVPRRDWLSLKVDEAKDYKLVYDLDLAKLSQAIQYGEDHSSEIKGAFDRVAYCLELQKENGKSEFVYVSMDAFTDDVKKIGIPTVSSGVAFQQHVDNLNVI